MYRDGSALQNVQKYFYLNLHSDGSPVTLHHLMFLVSQLHFKEFYNQIRRAIYSVHVSPQTFLLPR